MSSWPARFTRITRLNGISWILKCPGRSVPWQCTKDLCRIASLPCKMYSYNGNLINKSVNELARRCITSNISWINKLYPNKFFLDDKYMKSYNFKQAGPIKSFTDISWQPCLLFLVKVIPIYIKNNKNIKQIVITKHNAYWCPFRFILLKL